MLRDNIAKNGNKPYPKKFRSFTITKNEFLFMKLFFLHSSYI